MKLKGLQILSLQPQISKVFLEHQNNFFSQQVRTILVTKYHRIKRGLLTILDKIWLFRPQCRHIKAGPSTEHSKAHSVLSRWRRRRRWQSRTLLCTAYTMSVFLIFCQIPVTQNWNENQTKLTLCYIQVCSSYYILTTKQCN